MKKKEILNYLDRKTYCIVVPKYYELEDKPAWSIVFIGSKEDCKKAFSNYPDFFKATNDENVQNRKWRLEEYLFLLSIGKKAEAEKIRAQYNF